MSLHLHSDRLAGSPRELAGERVRHAGMSAELLTGGAGMVSAAPAVPRNANGSVVSAAAGERAHIGLLGLVLIATLVLFALDKAGFRFAVTAGKR